MLYRFYLAKWLNPHGHRILTGIIGKTLPGIWSRSMAVLMVFLSFWALGGHFWNDRYAKADIRGAVQYVQEHNTSDEAVFVPVITDTWPGRIKPSILTPSVSINAARAGGVSLLAE